MNINVIYDDEIIIGYSEDILNDILQDIEYSGGDELLQDLADTLKTYDHDLIKVTYSAMGSFIVSKLTETNTIYI